MPEVSVSSTMGPGECSMINRFLGDAFLFCPASFGVFCSLAAYTHLKLLGRAVSGVRFLTGGVLSVTLPIVDLCKLYKIRCNLMHPFKFLMVLYLDHVCQCSLCGSHVVI